MSTYQSDPATLPILNQTEKVQYNQLLSLRQKHLILDASMRKHIILDASWYIVLDAFLIYAPYEKHLTLYAFYFALCDCIPDSIYCQRRG